MSAALRAAWAGRRGGTQSQRRGVALLNELDPVGWLRAEPDGGG
jgi:hypothetical protein